MPGPSSGVTTQRAPSAPSAISIRAYALIIGTGIAARCAVWAYNYRGISLYCGDSASYYFLANHLERAQPDRPSGFPFFLHLLLAIDPSPAFLLLVNGALGIAAQLLFLRALWPYVPNQRLGLLLSFVIFLDPVFLEMNSMVFMADTLACFLLAASLALLMYERPKLTLVRSALAFVALGYLTIVKNAFVSFGPPAWLFVVLRAARDGTSGRRLAALAGSCALAFAIIPAWYSLQFNATRLGTTRLQNFSGRSLLANLLPAGTCADLSDVARTERERRAIARHCTDEGLQVGSGMLLWHRDSVMNAIEADLLDAPDRTRGNRVLGNLAWRLALHHPATVFGAVLRNMRAHLKRLERPNWTIDQAVDLSGGCEGLVRDYFGVEPAVYERLWRARGHPSWLPSASVANGIARNYSDLVDVVAFAGFLAAIAAAPWRWRGRPFFVFALALTALYCASIMVGSYYGSGARVYFVLNVLSYLSVALMLGKRT